MLDKVYALLYSFKVPNLRKPKAVTRKRIYDTGALVLGVAVVWGVIDAGDVAALSDSLDKLLGIGALILARRNVTPTD